MKVTTEKKIVRTGPHIVRKGEVADVPDDIAKIWIDAKFARPATPAEIKAAEKPAAS